MTKQTDSNIELTFTQCKQLIANGVDLRDFIERINDQPDWLISMGEIDSISEIQAILQGGCASGAYMPAVTYHTAMQTLGQFGDELFEYLEDVVDELTIDLSVENYTMFAGRVCSMAVEQWCSQFDNDLYQVNWD